MLELEARRGGAGAAQFRQGPAVPRILAVGGDGRCGMLTVNCGIKWAGTAARSNRSKESGMPRCSLSHARKVCRSAAAADPAPAPDPAAASRACGRGRHELRGRVGYRNQVAARVLWQRAQQRFDPRCGESRHCGIHGVAGESGQRQQRYSQARAVAATPRARSGIRSGSRAHPAWRLREIARALRAQAAWQKSVRRRDAGHSARHR